MNTPTLVGLEWSPEAQEDLARTVLQAHPEIDLVELIPENFQSGAFDDFLDVLHRAGTPVAVHGVHLSIGTLEPLDLEHLDRMIGIAERVNTIHFSDHLAMTRVAGLDLDALTPIAFTRDVLDTVCDKVNRIQDRTRRPFALENVAYRFLIPDCDFTETAFINELLRRTGCELLLDVTNVYTNSVNFQFDPVSWLDSVDLSRTTLVHLAGGYRDRDGFLMDSHDAAVEEGSWNLYEELTRRYVAPATIIERTGAYPGWSTMRAEVERARSFTTPRPPSLPSDVGHLGAVL